MAQKYKIQFSEKTIRRFKIKMRKLERSVKRYVDKDLIEFLAARFSSVLLKLIVREIIKLAAKVAIREAIVLGAGSATGATGVGAPAGGAIVVVGNVVIIIWMVVDAGIVIYNFRTIIREKLDEAAEAIKVQLEALKQVPEGAREFGKAVKDRVTTDLAPLLQVPEGIREFGKAFKNRGPTNLGFKRVLKGEIQREVRKKKPDFAFKADAKVQAPDLIEDVIDEWMGKAIRESYQILIKEWSRP